MTDCAVGRKILGSSRSSSEWARYGMSPARPSSIQVASRASLAWRAALEIPHRSKPTARACALRAEAESTPDAPLVGATTLRLCEAPCDVRQDAAVTEGGEFFGRIHAHDDVELAQGAVLRACADEHGPAWHQRGARSHQVEGLSAGQAERGRRVARRELERQHTHIHEIAAVDPLEAFGDD